MKISDIFSSKKRNLNNFRKSLHVGQKVKYLKQDQFVEIQIIGIYGNYARIMLPSGCTIGILIISIHPIN